MKENSVSDSLYEAMVAYYENELTQSQSEELIRWIGENNENLRYFQEIGKIWYASGLIKKTDRNQVEGWSKLLDKIAENDIRPMPKPVIRVPVSYFYRIAAALTLIISLGIVGYLFLKNRGIKQIAGFYEAVAPKGSRSVITLSDGSKVWLNSGTRIRYQSDFGDKSRDLFLEGEAYFVVAENKDKPFRVRTQDLCITALGTAFNVKAYNDENTVETTLEKGNVLVELIKVSKDEQVPPPVLLKPNQQALFIKGSGNLNVNESEPVVKTTVNIPDSQLKPSPIKVETLADTRIPVSWKDNKWIFKSEKLKDLAPILERRFDIIVIFKDTILSNYKFTGTIKEESLEQVLKALTLAAPIRFDVAHKEVYLYEDKNLMTRYSRQTQKQNK
jgi:transmembrane sensor